MFSKSCLDEIFPFKLYNGNLLIYPNRPDNPILLAPWNNFTVCRVEYEKSPILYECNPSCNDPLIDEVEEKLNTPKLAGIVDSKLFYNWDVEIDLTTETICLHPSNKNKRGYDLENVSYIPVLNTIINESYYKSIVYLSSKLSFIKKKDYKKLSKKTRNLYTKFGLDEKLKDLPQPIEKNVKEYLPFYGEIRSDVYRLPVQIDKYKFYMDFALLPDDLERELSDMGFIDCILGSELLTKFKFYFSVIYDYYLMDEIKQ